MRVLLVAGMMAALGAGAASAATRHHTTHSGHGSHSTHHSGKTSKSTSHHGTSSSHAKSGKSSHATKHEEKKVAAPSGAITVGSGGTKLFCAGRSNPLLVRKATQGNGTTVTVVCR